MWIGLMVRGNLGCGLTPVFFKKKNNDPKTTNYTHVVVLVLLFIFYFKTGDETLDL